MNVPTLQRPLAQGATTLVMRSTHLKLTNQEIMTLLNVLTVALGYKRPMYDFVYMPWAKLAIVNFVDHASYKAHFDKIQEVCDLGTEHPAIRNVAQAYIQGLAANLAFFLAKSGQQAVHQPHAPMVFQQGVQVPLQDAVQRHVSPELLASMELLYQMKLKKLRGISLLSHSAASSSGVWTSAERSPSPQGTTDECINSGKPTIPGSKRTKVSSQNALPYSHSQQLFPPLERLECNGDSLPVVIVHSTPKRLREKQNSLTSNRSKSDEIYSREICIDEKQNLEIPSGDVGRRKTTGNIRKRPNLGEPPPPPPPPPSRALPPPVPQENGLRDDDSAPELPEVDYSDYEFSEDDDEPFPPPPEAFCVAAEGEQLNQFDSTA